jgi:hypothetical protein
LLYESYLGDSATVITQMLFTRNGDLLLTGACKFGNAQQDAFLLRLTPNLFGAGLRVSQLSFLGGNCSDYAMSMQLDFKGNIWLSGDTISTDFPQTNASAPQSTTNAFTVKGFVAEISPDSSQLLFSQLFDLPARIALSTTSVYVANSTGRFGSLTKWFTTSSAGGAALFTRIDPWLSQ